MLLKRLELQGFKSFADKTVLDFEQGVTAVVGPNGSGKSNISDAIRWVMGEQSAKSLRGSNMQDVIFSGTETRKRVSYAEVSLVLDNTSHVFDLDYDEIIVTRRVFASGETAYQINRSNCRLKDIHELFMDTGLGRDGYSIIGQGNVSQILSTKAEDRRSLFEEAAGISKYKYRKEEAARKLVSVEENLTRIQDIAGELETQIEPLRRQSEKARKYMEMYGELKTLDVSISAVSLERNAVSVKKQQELCDGINGELEGIRQREAETESRLQRLYEQSREADSQQAENHSRLSENRRLRTELDGAVSIAQNNIKNNNARIGALISERASLEKRIADTGEEIAEFKRELEEKNGQAEKITESFRHEKAEIDGIEKRRAEVYAASEECKADIIEKMNEISSKKAQAEGIERLRKNFLERRDTLESELDAFRQDAEDRKRELAENEAVIADTEKKRDKMRARLDESVRRKAEKERVLAESTARYNELRIEYNKRESRRRILEDMENSYDGYAKSVKTVLTAKELADLSVYGTVAGLIDVDRKYVAAMETALGAAVQNIVVESEEDAKAAIAYLREQRAGRATFLPLSSVKGRVLDEKRRVQKMDGYLGIASELIRYDSRYAGIMNNLLGRVVVVDNIDNGIKMARECGYKFRIVTLLGDALNSGGSMSGGSMNKTAGMISRASEIKELASEISRITEEARSVKRGIETVNAELQTVSESAETYSAMLREYEDAILRAENSLSHLRDLIENGGSEEESCLSELSRIEEQLDATGDDIADILESVRGMESEIEKLRENAAKLDEKHSELNQTKEERSQALMDATMTLGVVRKDADVLKEKIASSERDVQSIKSEIEAKQRAEEALLEENGRYGKEIQSRREAAEQTDIAAESIQSAIDETTERKRKIIAGLERIQSSGKELTDRIILLQKELASAETKRAKLDMERETIINRLWDEYELPASEAAAMKGDIGDEKEAAARLKSLKASMKALGHVNMESIEEYKNVKERFEFLSAQKADLEKSRDNLNKIVESMGELMEEHFTKQFAVINESFEKVFRDLFGGGHGRLYLSNPENVLESGIEIEVQLPGKVRQNINLYSGGEKSFIAIALLFAILNVKPTPFCILDEIDAALDDVNVARFATYLKNYLSESQFIVITHRRGTMEAANILYGVTMQEKGVSKLLSLQIDDVSGDMAK